ncbi:MAG: hypothetical protein ACLPN6_29260 [Streptosporangiaceae bacterium]
MVTPADRRERERTEHALQTLTEWGKDPNIDGGENIAFSLSRQGAPGDAFLVTGDCTPFTASGARGTLHGQPAGDTGAPIAFIDDFGGVTSSIDQVPCTFAFDLNTGEVSLHGSFPGPPSALHFGVEFLTSFQGNDGKNMLFYSGTSSDHAGYIIAVQLVAAS